MITYLLLILSLLVPTAQAHTMEESHEHLVQDVFAFKSNEDQERLVAGFTLSAQAELNPDLLYQFNFDTNQDGIEDRVVQVSVSDSGSELEATVTEPSTPERTGDTVQRVKIETISGPVSTHANPVILAERGKSVRAFVGLRDDPIGGDARAGKNVHAIIVELPLSALLAEHKPDLDFWVSIYNRDQS